MSFTISRPIFASAIVFGSILLGGCDKDTIKNNLSSPTSSAVKASHDRFDSYYGLPGNASALLDNEPKIKRTVTRTKGVLKGDAPIRYKVRKGDTLWGIANKFLKNPWFWPEVWDKNQKITNPHLIFPGDVLYIYQGKKQTRGADSVTIRDRVIPRIRVERTDGIGQPISTIAPFLSWPRVLDEDTIKNAPYIVDGQDFNLLLEPGRNIYVKNYKGQTLERYAVFSVGKAMVDPDSGDVLGHEVNYGSQTQIEKTGTVATARLLNMKREVKVGDRLLNISNHEHQLQAPMQLPRHKVRGTVMALYDASMISGTGMIITLNKGKRDGIKLGYVLGVYQPSREVIDPYASQEQGYVSEIDKVLIPPERAATAVVYNVSERFSYALITKSDHAVRNGYKIGNP
ncbi:MAG: LysM peptidoglycan-binding domain-containing protein [Leucothrix sp.]